MRSTHVDAEPSRERSRSKSRKRSTSRGHRDVSRGPEPRTPAPAPAVQRQIGQGFRDKMGPIAHMSIYNAFDEIFDTKLDARDSFFMTQAEGERKRYSLMKDCGDYTYNS